MIQARDRDDNVEVYARMQGGEMTGMLVIAAEPTRADDSPSRRPYPARRTGQPERTRGIAEVASLGK